MNKQKKIASWKWRIYKAGMTQKDFCARIGMYQGHLSDIIRGEKDPEDKTMGKIEGELKALGV